MQREQAARLLGAAGALDFLVGPSYYALPLDGAHVVHDGWWVLGLIELGAALFQRDPRPAELLAWPLAIYAGTILVMGSGHVFTYHHLAVYPLAYLAAGQLAARAVKVLSAPGLVLTIGLPASEIRVPGLSAGALPWVVAALLLVVASSALAVAWWKRWLPVTTRRAAAWAAIGVVIAGSVAASVSLPGATLP